MAKLSLNMEVEDDMPSNDANDFFKTLFASFTASVQGIEQNLIARINQSDEAHERSLTFIKTEMGNLQEKFHKIDKDLNLIQDRQTKINELEKKIAETDTRLKKVESEYDRVFGFVKIIGGGLAIIGTIVAIISGVVGYLHH